MATEPFTYKDGRIYLWGESQFPTTVKMGLTPTYPNLETESQYVQGRIYSLNGCTVGAEMTFTWDDDGNEMYDYSRGGDMAQIYPSGQGSVWAPSETPEDLRKRAKDLDKQAKAAKRAKAAKEAAAAERKKDYDIARATYRTIATNAHEFAGDRITAANCLREMSSNR